MRLGGVFGRLWCPSVEERISLEGEHQIQFFTAQNLPWKCLGGNNPPSTAANLLQELPQPGGSKLRIFLTAVIRRPCLLVNKKLIWSLLFTEGIQRDFDELVLFDRSVWPGEPRGELRPPKLEKSDENMEDCFLGGSRGSRTGPHFYWTKALGAARVRILIFGARGLRCQPLRNPFWGPLAFAVSLGVPLGPLACAVSLFVVLQNSFGLRCQPLSPSGWH